MGTEIKELKEEINLLNKRIDILEKRDNQRRALAYGKIFIKIIILGALAFAVYRGYDYVVNELPNVIEEKLNGLNPLTKDS